jgi:sialic acid synthase SpsE/quercetin dioxygenase-like cupin family protein
MNEIFRDLFIFEMANNHQGSVEHGLSIIQAVSRIARKYGIRAGVKLQYRDLDTLVHPDFKERKDIKHVPRFLETRLAPEQFLTLVDAIRDEGMVTIVTPFDEPSVRLCLDHGIQIIKIASPSATDWPLIETAAGARKPMIISTGGISIYDIDNLVSFCTHRDIDFALMHCVGLYPSPPDTLQMNFIDKMLRRYPGVPVGYSGHESPENLDAVKVAVGKGATLLERHVGIATDVIKLNAYSMTPEQADVWVAGALAARQICGPLADKQISQAEVDSLRTLQRGVYATREIKQGETISKKDVFFAMPCQEKQTTSGEFGQKRATFTASRDYPPSAPIEEHRQPDTLSLIRSIIHDAKGMIYEAGIVLRNDFEIELSHHYGIEHFRQYGALILNIINREYCKKLVVLLSGQQHPNHRHKVKEETFQLLRGDLQVNLDGTIINMKPGDKLLIERDSWHSFTTTGGAIFEEVSTTHIKDDSYYEDQAIASLDPIQRKTVIDTW